MVKYAWGLLKLLSTCKNLWKDGFLFKCMLLNYMPFKVSLFRKLTQCDQWFDWPSLVTGSLFVCLFSRKCSAWEMTCCKYSSTDKSQIPILPKAILTVATLSILHWLAMKRLYIEQLTLAQHKFELHWTTYTWVFSVVPTAVLYNGWTFRLEGTMDAKGQL